MTAHTAELLRDEWGVPHVRADDEADAFFAVGYAQAEDQLDLLLRRYVSLLGREAETTGADAVERDFERLRWGHLDEARRAVNTAPEGLRAALDGFVAGATHYMTTHPDRVPAWAPALEPAMPLAINRAFLWSYMIGDGLASLAAAGVELLPEVAAEIRGAIPAPSASNEWFLAPERTADGVTALLSDPHGSIEHFPMFEVHVSAPGLVASGVMAIGAAVILIGHTHDIAWGMTTGAPRVSDAYAFERGRVQLEEVVATVDGIERTFRYVDHNGVRCPVVATDGATVYAVCTPYQHDGGGMDVALYRLVHARDVRGARHALADLGMFPQNVMVADRAGGCWYVRAGRVPKRAPHVDYSRPLDGHDPKAEWQGIHPIDDLVQIDSAPHGYLQNCNVAPDTMFAGAADSALGAANYAPYLFNVAPGMSNSRGERATELLSQCDGASIEELHAIATDEYWIGTDRWLDVLRGALDGPAADLDELLAFDGNASADSRAALVYLLWRESVVDLTDTVDAGESLTPDQQGTLVEAAHRAMIDASGATFGDRFRIRRGARSWPGRAGVIARHRELLVNADVIAPLRVMLFGPPDGDGIRWEEAGGRSLRLTVLGDRARSWSVVLYGQSGDPASPHYDDQVALYSERQLRDTRFDDPRLWDEHVVARLAVPA